MQATDHLSATVTWNDAAGADRLSFSYGCQDAAKAALARDLRDAPSLLSIATLIAPRR